MTEFLKRLLQFCMGVLILFMAGCAPSPTQPPTAEATGIPTGTSGIPVTPVQSTPSPTIPVLTDVSPTALSPTDNTLERIKFAAGSTSATVTGHLESSGSKQYILHALAGQTMTINLAFTAGRAILVVWGDDGNVLLSDHAEASNFQRQLPTTEDYHIQLKGSPEGSTDYSMTVIIPSVNSGAKRIEFAPGSASSTVNGTLQPSMSDQYIINVQAGQTMTIDLTFTVGQAILVVWGADGDVLISAHAEASNFQGLLPTTQDYFIMVKGRPDGNTAYSMTVTIPPAP
jgi:hypothetical protein